MSRSIHSKRTLESIRNDNVMRLNLYRGRGSSNNYPSVEIESRHYASAALKIDEKEC